MTPISRLVIVSRPARRFRSKTSRGLFGIVLLLGLARFVEPAHGHSGRWGFLRHAAVGDFEYRYYLRNGSFDIAALVRR